MKVLWFCNTPAASNQEVGSKGTGGWLKSLDKELQKTVDLHVAFYSKTNTKPFKLGLTTYYPICKNDDFSKFVNQFFPTVQDQQDLPQYLKIINQVRPDIIHIHGTELPFGCIASHTTIPVVFSIQGNLTVCHYKYFSGIEARYLTTRILNSFQSLFLRGFIRNYNSIQQGSKVEIKNLKDSKYVIGRTDWDRRIMCVMAPKAYYYHCDEILRDEFYLKEWSDSFSTSRPILVHTTSGENYYKGFETICYAIKLLNNIGIDVEWRVAGVSETSLLNCIVKKQLKDNYPSKGLVLLGNLVEDQLVNKLLEADMYVMASHIENSPNNLCEAMILGMPCISTFAGGSGSLLEDHTEGLLIQDGDPWAMAGAVIEMSRDRKAAVEYGKNARIKSLRRNNKEMIVHSLQTIYSQIINHSS